MQRTAPGIVGFGKDVVKRVGEADLTGLAAEMAYRFLFAIFPFILFIVALAGFFGTEGLAQTVISWMQDAMPEEAATLLTDPIRQVLTTQQAGLLSIGALLALWGASAVMATVVKGMNRTHKVTENRSFVRKTVTQVGLTLFLAVILLLAVAAVIVTQVVIGTLGVLDLGPALSVVARVAGPLVAFLVLLFGIAVIYWKAPAVDVHPFKLLSPGALFYAIGWTAGTLLLSWYVSEFGNYNQVYGTIGGLMVLLIWAYWSSFFLLLGGAINAVIEERRGSRVPLERDGQGHEVRPSTADQQAPRDKDRRVA